jgi:hypothetical protein
MADPPDNTKDKASNRTNEPLIDPPRATHTFPTTRGGRLTRVEKKRDCWEHTTGAGRRGRRVERGSSVGPNTSDPWFWTIRLVELGRMVLPMSVWRVKESTTSAPVVTTRVTPSARVTVVPVVP